MAFTNETGSPSNGSNLKESLGNVINPISVDDLELKSQESEQKISAELLSSLVKGIKDVDITPQSTESLILNQEEKVKSLQLEDISTEVCLDVPNLTDRYCESEVVTVSSDNIPTIKEIGSSKIEEEEQSKLKAITAGEDIKDAHSLNDTKEDEVSVITMSEDVITDTVVNTQEESLILDLDDIGETLNIEELVTDTSVDIISDVDTASEDITSTDDSIESNTKSSINTNKELNSVEFGKDSSESSLSTSDTNKPKRKRRKKKRSTSEEVLKAIDVIEHMDDETLKKEKEVDDKLDSMANILKESKEAMQKKNTEKQNSKVSTNNTRVNNLSDIWGLYSDEEKSNLRELDAKQKEEQRNEEKESSLKDVSNTEPKSINADIAVDAALEKLESDTTAVDLLTSTLPDGIKDILGKKSSITKKDIKDDNSRTDESGSVNEDTDFTSIHNEPIEEPKESNEFDKALNGLVTNIALEIWDEESSAVQEEGNTETINFVKDFLQGSDPRIVENNGDEYYEILVGLTERVINDGSNFFEVVDDRLKNLDISKFTQNIYKLIINEKVYYLFKEIPKHLMAHRQKYLKTKLGMIKALTEESKLADSVNLRIPKVSKSTSLPVFTDSEIKAIKDTLREDFIITKETQTCIFAMYRTFL